MRRAARRSRRTAAAGMRALQSATHLSRPQHPAQQSHPTRQTWRRPAMRRLAQGRCAAIQCRVCRVMEGMGAPATRRRAAQTAAAIAAAPQRAVYKQPQPPAMQSGGDGAAVAAWQGVPHVVAQPCAMRQQPQLPVALPPARAVCWHHQRPLMPPGSGQVGGRVTLMCASGMESAVQRCRVRARRRCSAEASGGCNAPAVQKLPVGFSV